MKFNLNRQFNLEISVPESKSVRHRDLIVNFLIDLAQDRVSNNVKYPISCVDSDSNDIKATKACINALAAIQADTSEVILPCGESGSTLRFMIPVGLCVLDYLGRLDSCRLIFTTAGRLFDRPLDDIENCLGPMGICFNKNAEIRTVEVYSEVLHLGSEYVIDGSVSSQNISGLLMGLALLPSDSEIKITGSFSSASYVKLTEDVLSKHGVEVKFRDSDSAYYVKGSNYSEHGLELELQDGDWSSGAFLMCMRELTEVIPDSFVASSSQLNIKGLNEDSAQGDKAIVDFIKCLRDGNKHKEDSLVQNSKNIPDIVPYMAVLAAFCLGYEDNYAQVTFTEIGRLVHKESNRIEAIIELLDKINVGCEFDGDNLTVYGINPDCLVELRQENRIISISSHNDHRMAMCDLMLALGSGLTVDVDDVNCMAKSFPALPEIMIKEFGI